MNSTTKKFIQYGAFMMALSVSLGAFGAHVIKSTVDEHMFDVYHTAVQYQFYHALGLFVVAFVAHFADTKKINLIGNIMIASTIVFSGSLYVLSLTDIKWLGAITPIGGVGFIVAWIMLGLSVSSLCCKTKECEIID